MAPPLRPHDMGGAVGTGHGSIIYMYIYIYIEWASARVPPSPPFLEKQNIPSSLPDAKLKRKAKQKAKREAECKDRQTLKTVTSNIIKCL